MNIKDKILSLSIAIILMISGVILLLDQLDVKYIDDYFTPWYLIIVLFFIASSLATAVIKKSPIFYVLTFLLSGIYLCISIYSKSVVDNVFDIIFIVPLFLGIGLIVADVVCKWSIKAGRLGFVLVVSSAIILISTILNVWTIVIPAVIILIGFSYIVFAVIDMNKSVNHGQSTDHYVKPTRKIKSQTESTINVDLVGISDETIDANDEPTTHSTEK